MPLIGQIGKLRCQIIEPRPDLLAGAVGTTGAIRAAENDALVIVAFVAQPPDPLFAAR